MWCGTAAFRAQPRLFWFTVCRRSKHEMRKDPCDRLISDCAHQQSFHCRAEQQQRRASRNGIANITSGKKSGIRGVKEDSTALCVCRGSSGLVVAAYTHSPKHKHRNRKSSLAVSRTCLAPNRTSLTHKSAGLRGRFAALGRFRRHLRASTPRPLMRQSCTSRNAYKRTYMYICSNSI